MPEEPSLGTLKYIVLSITLFTHIHEKMTLQFLLSPINDSFDWVDAYHFYWAILPHFLGLLVFNNKTYKTPYRFSVSTISKRHSTKYKIRERGQN